LLFNRAPTEKETRLALTFLSTSDGKATDVWPRYLHVLLGSNEFLFID
jgi:hypothetical protein